MAVPQLHGQYEGDKSRKDVLVEHGFRLPSALDNRPLRFDEFTERVGQVVFVSATPGPYEREVSTQVVEQVIRPTGLVDPEVVDRAHHRPDRRPARAHRRHADRGERVLVTTLTKKMAEDLTDYLVELGVRVRYLHSDIDTITRIELLRDLRLGEFDVLVGHQPAARGPRPARGPARGHPRRRQDGVLALGLVADPDDGARRAQRRRPRGPLRRHHHRRHAPGDLETQRRRALQQAYNAEHGIDPTTIRKAVTDILAQIRPAATSGPRPGRDPGRRPAARPRRPTAGPAGAPGRDGRRPTHRPVDEMRRRRSALPVDELNVSWRARDRDAVGHGAALRGAALRDEIAELPPGEAYGELPAPTVAGSPEPRRTRGPRRPIRSGQASR